MANSSRLCCLSLQKRLLWAGIQLCQHGCQDESPDRQLFRWSDGIQRARMHAKQSRIIQILKYLSDNGINKASEFIIKNFANYWKDYFIKERKRNFFRNNEQNSRYLKQFLIYLINSIFLFFFFFNFFGKSQVNFAILILNNYEIYYTKKAIFVAII